jgi:hypothetical protein
MKPTPKQLPPIGVKVFSWLFLFGLAAPLFAIYQIRTIGTQISISAFGLSLKGGQHSLLWILALDFVLFMAGLASLFILVRRKFAYDFGIFYCVITLLITITVHVMVRGHNEMTLINVLIQYPLLLLFLIHLIRYRRHWIMQRGEQGGGGNSVALRVSP